MGKGIGSVLAPQCHRARGPVTRSDKRSGEQKLTFVRTHGITIWRSCFVSGPGGELSAKKRVNFELIASAISSFSINIDLTLVPVWRQVI